MLDRRGLFVHALRLGLLLGAGKIVLLAIAHILGVWYLVSPTMGIVMMVLAFAFMLYGVYSGRRFASDGQGLLWAQGFVHLWLLYAFGNLLYTLATILLFHVIDPGLREAAIEPMVEMAKRALSSPTMTEEEFDRQIAELRAQDPFSVGGQIRGYLGSLIPATFGAGLLSFLFRRTTPPAEASDESAIDPGPDR